MLKEDFHPRHSFSPRSYWVLLALLLFVVRYLPYPCIDFCGDDWSAYLRSIQNKGLSNIFNLSMQERDRPIYIFSLLGFFSLFGVKHVLYTIFSYVVHVVVVLLVYLNIRELCRNCQSAFCAALLFIVLPNIQESYLWKTMIIASPFHVGYLLSLYAFLLYMKRDTVGWLVLSICSYALALPIYETGIFIPVSYLVLLVAHKTQIRKSLYTMAGYGIVGIFYLLWKFNYISIGTSALFFVSRKPEISLYGIMHRSLDVSSWWIGRSMGYSILNGLKACLDSSWIVLVVLLSTIVFTVLVFCYVTKGKEGIRARGVEAKYLWVFFCVWFGLANVLSLVSWTASRLNMLPAFGAVGFVAVIWRNGWWQKILISLFIVLGISVAWGSNIQWYEAGKLSRKLYNELVNNTLSWCEYKYMVFDSNKLRESQLTEYPWYDVTSPELWANMGNACLFRGFVPSSMLQLANGSDAAPKMFLDTECGIYISDSFVTGYERYNPAKKFVLPRSEVWVVELPISVEATSDDAKQSR